MKLLCLLALLAGPIHAQQILQLPVGKWQLVEREGNDGAKDFRTPVKEGRVLTFYPEYLVRDNKGAIGKYIVHENHLQLLLPQNKMEYYLWFFSIKVPDKLYMTPVSKDYQCYCDEGCMDIYQKL